MVEISASMVKELRDRTGAAMMDCKKALVEASGDAEKAVELLRQKGIAVAGKKASRAASEGLVVGEVTADGKGVLLEVNCETDFVARNPEFIELTEQLRRELLKSNPAAVEDLLKLKVGSGTVQDLITEKVAKIGENILVRRFAKFELGASKGSIGLYIHALGGKMGALLELQSTKDVPAEEVSALSKEIAMHIVSAKPSFVSREEIPAEVIENERRIEAGKADLADKKPELRDKIVQGRVDKLLAERCLLEQPFVKDPSQTIAQYLKGKGQGWGADLKPIRFSLFILGESQASEEDESNGNA